MKMTTAAMKIAACAAVALLASCRVPVPSSTKLEDAKIGPAPSREKAIQAATQSLKKRLPETPIVSIGFGEAAPGFYAIGSGSSLQRFAWQLVASVDAENEFGFREGAKPYHFYFLGDRLVATASPATSWNGVEYRPTYDIVEFDGGGRTGPEAGFLGSRRAPGM